MTHIEYDRTAEEVFTQSRLLPVVSEVAAARAFLTKDLAGPEVETLRQSHKGSMVTSSILETTNGFCGITCGQQSQQSC